MGFFESATTANFWADDFLGGLSFMTGTVISEALWAAGTGGASLGTTAARVSLRGAKYFKTAQSLTKGVKEAQKTLKTYNKLIAMKSAAKAATTAGKIGETANLLRFTYTGAGFEAGMEARLYQKEQRDNFNRDFETLNGRQPEALDIAEFEDNLGKTTNALWATNMALVGTSNLAILGKTFGVTSPFKLQSKSLNKALFGIGEVNEFGAQGQRLASTAIKRSGLQKTLGFSKAILANPFMEGVVEEGGQAASSSAMESYVTSRYNPSEDVMGMAESMYEGLAHTYGTKEGWKEVGLGALIGFFGGEATNVLSGQGFFKEAMAAKEDQDAGSVERAKNLNDNLGTSIVDRVMASKVEQSLNNATSMQAATQELSEAEKKGDLMGAANAQSNIMLTSVKQAVDGDYLEDQVSDFRTALDLKTDEEIADHYEIDISEVESQKEKLTDQYRELGAEYKTAKEFADYTISDNPKELFDEATDVDVAEARGAIAYQMVMTGQMETNMIGAHTALMDSITGLRPAFAEKYRAALTRFDQLRRSSAKDVAALGEAENNLKSKRRQIDLLDTRLKRLQEKIGSTPESRQRASNKINAIENKMAEVQTELEALTVEVADKAGNLATTRSEIEGITTTSRALANQLDMIDPLSGAETVEQSTIEETQQKLEELDKDLANAAKANPQLVTKISKLAQEYKKGLEMWQRNADTLADLTDPELGLKRIGTMFQRKKMAGETTLKFLERLKRTREEQDLFTTAIGLLVTKQKGTTDTEVVDPNDPDNLDPNDPENPTNNEQTKASNSPGEDITVETEEEILVGKRAQLEKERQEELAAVKEAETGDTFENNKEYTPKEFKKFLKFSNVFNKNLYNVISDIAGSLGVKIVVSTDAVSTYGAGIFDSSTNTIRLHLPSFQKSYENQVNGLGRGDGQFTSVDKIGSFEEYLTYAVNHELIHGITSKALIDVQTKTRKGVYKGNLTATQVKAVLKLNEIHQYLQGLDQSFFGRKEYAFTNMHELLAEMANEGFVETLQNIELPINLRYAAESTSVFENIVEYLRQMLTGKSIKDNAATSLYNIISDIVAQDIKSNKSNSAEVKEINARREVALNRVVDTATGSRVRDDLRLKNQVNDKYDTEIASLTDSSPLQTAENTAEEAKKINAKYDAKLKNLNKKKPAAKKRQKTAQDKIDDLKAKLKELVTKNNFLLQNFTDQADNLSQEKAPTESNIQEYEKLKENVEPNDAAAIVSTPIDKISKKVKERVGLTDEQIARFQELAQKMQDWRIVTATNSKGISVQDILDQIEAYEMTVEGNNTQVSAEQQLEMAREGEKSFSVGETDKDIAQTMSYVNTAKEGSQIVFSHLDVKTIEDNGYTVEFEREENIGSQEKPVMVEVYTISKVDPDTNQMESFEIRKVKSNSRIAVSETLADKFIKGMGFEVVKYKLKTAWGYVFKNGELLKSDFGISSIDQSETEIMHPELIYELKPGEKLSFVVSIKDEYNFKQMQALVAQGDLKGAEANMAIYITNKDGKVVGMLKAGQDSKNTNFNKVRKAAIKVLTSKLIKKELTVEDVLDNNTETSFSLPYEVEVEKIFIGTPDIKLKPDGSLETFKITEAQYGRIEGKGYAENGKLEQEDPEVRMTFIPKDKNTPYVIIRQGNTKIAFPVGVSPTASTLQQQVMDILESDLKKQNQVTEIVKLLARNGVDPVQFNLNILNTNEKELKKLLDSLDTAERTFTKEELRTMSKEDFLAAAEIVVNLENPAFVSPKVKTTLSKGLLDKETKEETKDEPLTLNEKLSLILNNSVILSKATNKKEVAAAVLKTEDSVLQEEFNNNKEFKKQVEDFAIANTAVPVIETEYTIENLIEETVDLESEDVPLDLKEQFKQDVADLIANPTKAKIKALGKKLLTALNNRYTMVKATMDTENLYSIFTTESQEEMFAQGFVRIAENLYKKIDSKITLEKVLEGLYMKYRKGTLPNRMGLTPNMSMDQFTAAMPKTLLDVYKKYYDAQPEGPVTEKAVLIGNEQYFKEEFKGDFAALKIREAKAGTMLYEEVLSHMSTTALGVIKSKSLTREKIDEFQNELGPFYSALLQYSLINKHIDLQERPQTIIFAKDVETRTRIDAVNSSSLKEAKGTMQNFNNDGSITLGKGNADFVTYKDQVYEKVQDAGNGEYDYYPIAKVDRVFYVTEVATPFINKPNINNKEINEGTTTVSKTDKDGGLNCP